MSAANESKKVAPAGAPIQEQDASSDTFEGTVVSVTGNTLVMSNKEGKEYSHTFASDATITCDGTACKPEDLKTGGKVRVGTAKSNRRVATRVDSLDKNVDFAQCCD